MLIHKRTLHDEDKDKTIGYRPKMSTSHGLSDEQVSNELKRMVAFIKQEAIEKSREIHIKVNLLLYRKRR